MLDIDYFPLINFFTLVFLMIVALYCYMKVRRYIINLVIFLFSLIIGINSMSATDMPFNPMFQIFFLVFHTTLILIMSIEVHAKRESF
jgi:hypothetical protein